MEGSNRAKLEVLILTRKRGQLIQIDMAEIDPLTPVGHVFAGGPIKILVVSADRGRAKLGIEVDLRFFTFTENLVE